MDPNARRLKFSVSTTPDAGINARTALLPLSEVLSAEAFSDLRLIISELVSNSVAHGPSGQIEVVAELRADGSVYGSVADKGQGITGSATTYAEPGEGLGLLIVEALAERWGMQPDRGEVWFQLEAQELSSPHDMHRRVRGHEDEG